MAHWVPLKVEAQCMHASGAVFILTSVDGARKVRRARRPRISAATLLMVVERSGNEGGVTDGTRTRNSQNHNLELYH